MLTPAHAAFIARHTSISVAARDARNRPTVGRALGCRVAEDLRTVTVFLSASRSAEVLACLRENCAIALAVTRPTTNQTLQLKGMVTAIVPATVDDTAEIAAYCESFVEELAVLGYGAELARGVLAGADDSVAVVFALGAVFDQTPGPQAGRVMDARV
ncbi:MAG: hypothetical protein Q8L95_04890 [Burkholderiales bacterium]|nr:hypothetical protein [Burkholderiales bacterium]